MAGTVWKRLSPGDLEAFRAFLAALPAAGGPRYGLLGVKVSWWTRLGGGARPFVVLLAGGQLALTKRSWRGHRDLTSHRYPLAHLQRLKVRRGLLLESVRLTFADGYSLRLGSLPRRHSLPLERFLAGDPAALDPAALTPEQLTNFCPAMAAVGLRPIGRRAPASQPAAR